MAKEYAKAFYRSKKWNNCRTSYISNRILIDGGLCEECHKAAGYIVHHKITLTELNINDADISLNHNNLEYVCKACHDLFEGHGLKGRGRSDNNKPLFVFDDDGQPISLREIDNQDTPHKYI